jgi:membrane protease YdiL (CAAX protease family)
MNSIMIANRWLLAGSIVVICMLTFVWPFAVSPDPSHPLFRIIAIAALTVFLFALTAILFGKACKAPRT